VLVLPMLICLGPWVAMIALAAISVDAIYGDRLLTPDEKQQIAEGLGCYRRKLLPAKSLWTRRFWSKLT